MMGYVPTDSDFGGPLWLRAVAFVLVMIVLPVGSVVLLHKRWPR